MQAAPIRQSRSLGRLAVAGLLLPAIMAGVDHALFAALTESWRPGMALTALTMAVLVVQIGVMGIVCGSLPDWPWLGWILYGWSWLLVDAQALLVRQLAVENVFGRNAAFLTGSLFAAQIGLILVWAVLGQTRWSTRWPLSLVLATLLSVPLWDLSYSADNAALFFLTQIVITGGICAVLRWKGFHLSISRHSSTPADRVTPAEDLQESQFGLRHILVWTTALALVLSLLRLIGLPWDEWANARFFRAWLVFVSSGTAVGIVLAVAIWAALAQDRASRRWLLLVLITPFAAFACGMIEWLLWIWQWRSSGGIWIGRPPTWVRWGDWRSWQLWRDFFPQEGWLMAWICLAGAMLFATLLFLRSLGYRLKREAPGK